MGFTMFYPRRIGGESGFCVFFVAQTAAFLAQAFLILFDTVFPMELPGECDLRSGWGFYMVCSGFIGSVIRFLSQWYLYAMYILTVYLYILIRMYAIV